MKRFLFAALCLSLISDTATAQNANSVINLFGGLMQSAMSQAARSAWEKIGREEASCVENSLRSQGTSLNALIQAGIGPTDQRVSELRATCRTVIVQTSTATRPSFDCNKATLPDERAICSNAELARLERLQSEGFASIRSKYGEQTARSIAIPALRSRQSCQASVDCIRQVLSTAIKTYQEAGASIQMPSPVAPPVTTGSPYTVAGITLGQSAQLDSPTFQGFQCSPSTQLPGLTQCNRTNNGNGNQGQITDTLAHTPDMVVAFLRRSLERATFQGNEAYEEIERISKRYGPARTIPMPSAPGLPAGVIAVWGTLSLELLDSKQPNVAALVRSRIAVDHLGDASRTVSLGLPLYRINSGKGFVWTATWDATGSGKLRFSAIDADAIYPNDNRPKALLPPLPSLPADPVAPQLTELERLKTQADGGDAVAQVTLGEAFADGRGISKDEAQAVGWFTKAATLGNARAQYRLGIMFAEARGTAADNEQALAWLKKSAELKNVDAIKRLGLMYGEGRGVPQDRDQSIVWYRLAANAGDLAAKTIVAKFDEEQRLLKEARDNGFSSIADYRYFQDQQKKLGQSGIKLLPH